VYSEYIIIIHPTEPRELLLALGAEAPDVAEELLEQTTDLLLQG
jgi:hypothetical protein